MGLAILRQLCYEQFIPKNIHFQPEPEIKGWHLSSSSSVNLQVLFWVTGLKEAVLYRCIFPQMTEETAFSFAGGCLGRVQ